MSRILPFCRGYLEHLELTLTNEAFQVVSLDYYVHIEQKGVRKKGIPSVFGHFHKRCSKVQGNNLSSIQTFRQSQYKKMHEKEKI